jgi:hypothetical protein
MMYTCICIWELSVWNSFKNSFTWNRTHGAFHFCCIDSNSLLLHEHSFIAAVYTFVSFFCIYIHSLLLHVHSLIATVFIFIQCCCIYIHSVLLHTYSFIAAACTFIHFFAYAFIQYCCRDTHSLLLYIHSLMEHSSSKGISYCGLIIFGDYLSWRKNNPDWSCLEERVCFLYMRRDYTCLFFVSRKYNCFLCRWEIY